MKNKKIKTKTKRIGILTLWLTLCILGQAQTSGIWTMPNFIIDNSIIREWQQKYALVYTYTNRSNVHFVHLLEQGNTIAFSAKIQDEIRDMEILGDTAYYCGNDANGVPIVGYFSIPDFMAGTLNIERLTCISATNYHPNRMEVFKVQDGVHVVMVGDEMTLSGEYRMVADLSHHYPLNSWCLNYYIATDQIEFFDDIAVTDNYVVTAAHKHQSDAIYTRMFEKPTTTDQSLPNGNIFYSTSSPAIYNDIYFYTCDYNVISGPPDWPVWMTSTTNDNIAIACMSRDNSTEKYGFTIKTMTVTPSSWGVGSDVFVSLGVTLNPAWSVRDLRYSFVSKKLLLLQDTPSPISSVESTVTVADNSSPNLMTSYFDNYYTRLHSLDKAVAIPNGYMTLGVFRPNQEFTWDLNDPTVQNCFIPQSPSSTLNTCKMIPFPMAIRSYSLIPFQPILERIPVTKHTIHEQCR